MKKDHDAEWQSAQAGISSILDRIELSRPCKFCRVAYTKTPRLHTTKCLPLLQLSFLRNHVRYLGSDVGGCPNVGCPQPDEGRGPKGRRTTADQVSQEGRKGSWQAGKSGPGSGKRPHQEDRKQTHLLTLARMMARHEMALQQLEADRSWVIFW